MLRPGRPVATHEQPTSRLSERERIAIRKALVADMIEIRRTMRQMKRARTWLVEDPGDALENEAALRAAAQEFADAAAAYFRVGGRELPWQLQDTGA